MYVTLLHRIILQVMPANPYPILGLEYLAQAYGKKLGKANVSGYCIKFKTLKDINIDILEAAMRYGVEQEL